jgi:hypothetical protein
MRLPRRTTVIARTGKLGEASYERGRPVASVLTNRVEGGASPSQSLVTGVLVNPGYQRWRSLASCSLSARMRINIALHLARRYWTPSSALPPPVFPALQ